MFPNFDSLDVPTPSPAPESETTGVELLVATAPPHPLFEAKNKTFLPIQVDMSRRMCLVLLTSPGAIFGAMDCSPDTLLATAHDLSSILPSMD